MPPNSRKYWFRTSSYKEQGKLESNETCQPQTHCSDSVEAHLEECQKQVLLPEHQVSSVLYNSNEKMLPTRLLSFKQKKRKRVECFKQWNPCWLAMHSTSCHQMWPDSGQWRILEKRTAITAIAGNIAPTCKRPINLYSKLNGFAGSPWIGSFNDICTSSCVSSLLLIMEPPASDWRASSLEARSASVGSGWGAGSWYGVPAEAGLAASAPAAIQNKECLQTDYFMFHRRNSTKRSVETRLCLQVKICFHFCAPQTTTQNFYLLV